ncbi:protein ABHD13 [Daktulosphaira vitifoliae]|uniref:protein ABHD13 n=1 Tax=Daktulosphaira vitifoliae TaxID=58002 RepID=UPI0021A98AE2|nr:protein ABHD13 [Daktulosphaira vitifoliae]
MERLQTWFIRKDKLCFPFWKTMSTKCYMAFSAISAGATFVTFILLYWFFGGLLALSFLLVSIIGFVYHSEDYLLYYPDLPDHSRIFVPQPSMYGMPFENIYIKSLDGTRLHIFLIKQPGEASKIVPTILFLHGNAGNMGHRLTNIHGFYNELSCNIVMLEYRGYGLSHGSPSERGLYMDASAAMDFILSRTDLNLGRIIVFGRSLGGAVAIDLAARIEYSQKIWCVIVENTFTSIPDMATVLMSSDVLKYVPLCLYKNKFMSNWKMSKMQVPILFVSGEEDTLVPPAMMTNLFDSYCGPLKQIVRFRRGSHNTTWNCPGYYKKIRRFLKIIAKHKPNTGDLHCVIQIV